MTWLNRSPRLGVPIFLEIGQSAVGQHVVTLDQRKGFNIGGRGQPFIKWSEILVARRQQFFELSITKYVCWKSSIAYFVRMTRSRSKPMRLGEELSSENALSATDDSIPAPKIRSPAEDRIRPNSTVYQ